MSPFTLLVIPAFSLLSFFGWELHPAVHSSFGQVALAPPLDIPCYRLFGEDDPKPALRRRDFAAAIAAQRVFVSQMCENQYRWIVLARIYQLAGKNREALQIAAYVFERAPNRFMTWLYPEEYQDAGKDDPNEERFNPLEYHNLEPLLEIPGWAESEWGRAWTAAWAARNQRIVRGSLMLAALPPEQRPAEFMVAGEDCPLECCNYQEWSVKKEIELFASANGPNLGRKLQPGDRVHGLKGNKYLRPLPIFVQHAVVADDLDSREKVEIAAGELIFELELLGEGYAHIWYRGRSLSLETGHLRPHGCLVIDAECWGDFLDRDPKPEVYRWWVQVRLEDGSTAWVRAKGFGNQDACR